MMAANGVFHCKTKQQIKKKSLYFEVTMSPTHSGLMYKLVHKTRISTSTIDTPLLAYMITCFCRKFTSQILISY